MNGSSLGLGASGGWAAEDGFYRMPVFVVTHRPHDVVVKGETTFTFVTGGIKHAIEQASVTAGDKLVHIMGGASIIQQALRLAPGQAVEQQPCQRSAPSFPCW